MKIQSQYNGTCFVREHKNREFFYTEDTKRTESCDIYGLLRTFQSGIHGHWGSDWYVQSFPGACCSRFIEGSAYKKNEIGTPFRGSLSHLFVGTVLQQPLLIIFYIFSGTLILNMVSTLKITFFTPMHRARRACCTAGSAPWMRQLP